MSRPCLRPLIIEPKKPLKTGAENRFRAKLDAHDNPTITLIIGPSADPDGGSWPGARRSFGLQEGGLIPAPVVQPGCRARRGRLKLASSRPRVFFRCNLETVASVRKTRV